MFISQNSEMKLTSATEEAVKKASQNNSNSVEQGYDAAHTYNNQVTAHTLAYDDNGDGELSSAELSAFQFDIETGRFATDASGLLEDIFGSKDAFGPLMQAFDEANNTLKDLGKSLELTA